MLGTTLLWLIALELFALAAVPLAYRAFSRMPDRGLTFAAPMGLLGVGFLAWLIGLTQTVTISRWSVLLAFLAFGFSSALAGTGKYREIAHFARTRWPVLLASQSLFLAVFLGITILRATVSEVSHTEQPMDLMFLNATVSSSHYPPTDPWFSGESVSYYYMGYLLIGSVAIVTGIATAVAYNLGLATVGAMGAIAAFGLTFNLVVLARGSRDAGVLAGLATTFLLLVASNLAGTLELAKASGAGSVSFWEALGINGLTAGQASSTWHPDDGGWWWWRASRVIPGAITEFPAFSFLLGDLHPHVMSIGFVLLSAAVATQIYLQPGLLQRNFVKQRWPLLVVTVVSLGSLAAINLWDFPLGIALVSTAVLLNSARNERRLQLGRSVAMAGDLLVVGAATGPQFGDPLPSVRLYGRTTDGWQFVQLLEAHVDGGEADFGASVATDGEIIVVSSTCASGTGAAYVYRTMNGIWAHRHTLRPMSSSDEARFGVTLAVNQGTIAVAGAQSIYLFIEEQTQWTLAKTIKISEPQSPALCLDGDRLAIGLPSTSGGTVEIHGRTSRGWRRTKVIRPDSVEVPHFGASVILKSRTLVVGGDGIVATFRRLGNQWVAQSFISSPDPSAIDSFGSAIDLDGSHLIVGTSGASAPAPKAGLAFIYVENDAGWDLQERLYAEDTGVDARFGSAVALTGDNASVGAPGGGQGGVYTFHRSLDRWAGSGKIVGRWRFGRALLAGLLLITASVVVVLPFFFTFESAASGIEPLREIITRPMHMFVIWGVFGLLVLPLFALSLRHIFEPGAWGLSRFAVAILGAMAPVVFWLQPIYGPPIYAIAIMLFALHQIGYRLPHADEALFAYNPRLTLIAGSFAVVVGLLWDGVVNGERSVNGELLALDRLLVVVPIAVIVGLALYGAWTLAHRDSEVIRLAPANMDQTTRWNGLVPMFVLLSIAGGLVMGAELFHVSDVFGGFLRRQNTVFKLYYQAWILLSVLGGFGLWYVGSKWNLRTLIGRLGITVWAAVLIFGFGAVSYYPFAGLATRTADQGGFELNSLAHLEERAPTDHAIITWVQENTPRNAVVLEAALVPCPENPAGCSDWKPELGRIASSTGRPTLLGWEGHERQWRSKETDFDARRLHVRTIYETENADEATALIDFYSIAYIVVGPRERSIYGINGLAKFSSIGSVAFDMPGTATIYKVLEAEGT